MKKLITLLCLATIFLSSCAQDVTPPSVDNSLRPESEGEVVKHTYYSLAYSEANEQAMWVYYILTPEMVNGSASRQDDFREDHKVSTGSAELSDYSGSGYDRGHLCPAASMSINAKAMSESFLMSNMSPQLPSFNRGGWKSLESIVRNFAVQEGEVHVVTGPIFTDPIGTIGANEVTVPSKYYKVVYAPKSEKMIAFVLPNAKIEAPLESYAVTVNAVEELTGIDFFSSMMDAKEEDFESTFDIDLWQMSSHTNVSSKVQGAPKVQCNGVTKSGKRCRRHTTNPNGFCYQHQNQQ